MELTTITLTCKNCNKDFQIKHDLSFGECPVKYCDSCVEDIEKNGTKEEQRQKALEIEAKRKKSFEFRLERFESVADLRFKDVRFKNLQFEEKFNSMFNILTKNNFKVKDKNNKCFIVTGNAGSGKTTALMALYYQLYVKNNINTEYVRLYTLLRKFKDSFGNYKSSAFIEKYSNIPVLLIDEISVLKGSDTDFLFLHEIIDNRYNGYLTTVLAGNIDGTEIANELQKIFGVALTDRFMDKDWRVKVDMTKNSFRRI